MSKKYLTLAEAGREVGLSPVTLRAYANGRFEPKLITEMIGKTHVVTPANLDKWKKAKRKTKKEDS